jgi:3-hydroxyacyl-CoA dehydrogenase
MTQAHSINTVAVLGSGVMGAGIAALLANAGCTVHLLDIVPKDATDRSMLAKTAIDKQLKAKPAGGFTHPRNAKRVIAGNLEDDLGVLGTCDWIIEVVLEDVTIKQSTYKKIDAHRKAGSIVSSNTSTLPLHVLIEGLPDSFKADFCITHFFNPPRFLPLLEVTGGNHCKAEHLARITEFGDIALGKGVVHCKDTPGFLANRIGIFWMLVGLNEALRLGISVEDADAVMGKPVGIPKTALFGLFDLIGIDLMPHIAKAMLATLPTHDRFREIYQEPELVRTMIAEGYTGRKGKGGFYMLDTAGGKKTKLAKNLRSGAYEEAKESTLQSVEMARAGLSTLLNHSDIGGQFAKAVLVQTLHYAASLVPEISDDILNIDEAMRLGFAWKYGPFELIDRVSNAEQTGTDWLIAACIDAGLDVPPLLTVAAGKTFYKTEHGIRYALGADGAYIPLTQSSEKYMLADVTLGKKPVLKNAGAQLWDMGNGITCLQFTTKMNTIDDQVLEMMVKSVAAVKSGFKGLVIATDTEQFSLGANLGFLMYLANLADWRTISKVIKAGQDAVMGFKYAPFPVVAAINGMALGGGCETALHCDAVQAHMESYAGLVEVGVGLIPGWGGCKEMLLRHQALAQYVAAEVQAGKKPSAMMPQGPMPIISQSFEKIMLAQTSTSAEDARDMLILNSKSRISMNRKRVLPDAIALCTELSTGYTAPEPATIHLAGDTAKVALLMAIDGFKAQGKATPHDVTIGQHLAVVLSGGNTSMATPLTEQALLDLEHDMFMELIKTKASRDRIQHMLDVGKPLRN